VDFWSYIANQGRLRVDALLFAAIYLTLALTR
jgi:hypothetical protein